LKQPEGDDVGTHSIAGGVKGLDDGWEGLSTVPNLTKEGKSKGIW